MMYKTETCGYCRRLRRGLDEAGIDYDVIDVDEDANAAEWVKSVNGGNRVVPTLKFADGSHETNPTVSQVRQKLQGLNEL